MNRGPALWPTRVAAGLGFLNGGYMIFDGLHRLITGDFVRIEGQLGPWADLASFVGIDPMGMGIPFVTMGFAWCVGVVGLLMRRRWGRITVLALAVVSLLYLVFGTIVSAAILALLFLERGQGSRRESAHADE